MELDDDHKKLIRRMGRNAKEVEAALENVQVDDRGGTNMCFRMSIDEMIDKHKFNPDGTPRYIKRRLSREEDNKSRRE